MLVWLYLPSSDYILFFSSPSNPPFFNATLAGQAKEEPEFPRERSHHAREDFRNSQGDIALGSIHLLSSLQPFAVVHSAGAHRPEHDLSQDAHQRHCDSRLRPTVRVRRFLSGLVRIWSADRGAGCGHQRAGTMERGSATVAETSRSEER